MIETHDGKRLEFEVIGIVEDDDGLGYAVCYNEEADEFVVTDDAGKLLEDEDLAQEILDDFFELAENEDDEEATEAPKPGEERPQA